MVMVEIKPDAQRGPAAAAKVGWAQPAAAKADGADATVAHTVADIVAGAEVFVETCRRLLAS